MTGLSDRERKDEHQKKNPAKQWSQSSVSDMLSLMVPMIQASKETYNRRRSWDALLAKQSKWHSYTLWIMANKTTVNLVSISDFMHYWALHGWPQTLSKLTWSTQSGLVKWVVLGVRRGLFSLWQAAARPILPEDIRSALGSRVERGLWGHVILRDCKDRRLLPPNSLVPLG